MWRLLCFIEYIWLTFYLFHLSYSSTFSTESMDKALYSVFPFIKQEIQSVQSLSRVWLFATPWTGACQASLSITNSWSLLRLESVRPSNHLILCHPLLLSPSIVPSIRAFSNESVLHIRWPKYWSFGFSISPSNEYSGLIFFRIACNIDSDNISDFPWFWFDNLDSFEEDWSSICSLSLCLDILVMIISLGLCLLRWR